MEATTFLCNDHRKVEQMFRDYQALTESETATTESKRMCVEKMAAELSMHTDIEERKLYPMVRQRVPDAADLVDESLDEHQNIRDTLAELEMLDPEDSSYDERVHTLITDVKHHVQEEEHQLFPKLRAECSVQELQHLGQELQDAKASAMGPQPEVIREEVKAPSEETRRAER